ncbi:MAG TPA: S8 family serine peptidase [Steroidobacteraceae bacterium]|nr:S8 family serine peptidase [Steroidobacteraceae bacterium]
MKPANALGCGCAVLAAILSGSTWAGGGGATVAASATRPIIVIMKNRFRGADALNDQAPVVRQLNQTRSRRMKQFKSVNALATTATDAEVAQLKANSAVALVVPDVTIQLGKRKSRQSTTAAGSARSLKANVIPGACGANGKALLDPEALQTTNTSSDDPTAKTARSLGFTGAGVKVAWIADGLDPNNINFIRRNGQSVFIDYEDFSGDGPGQPTAGDEAFLDANSIAGQGLVTYNVNGFSAQPDPGACNIRIEGMAPGASLVGLDVFGLNEITTQSALLEAIDYAIYVAHVDVINESFGSNAYPDVTALDATKLFNEAAVEAGITVTVSSGDAGPFDTIGSPATDPAVISVGASTTYRYYAQTNYAAARYFATTGWLNDNISPLSSSGFFQQGGTIDLVAPGDAGFASCEASAEFSGCTNLLSVPSNVEESGGTSQSAPLTAGAAALVIEAYRKGHHGASPSPALVKQILTSTATDLGAPASEEGSGLVNSYKAVLLAQSINNGNGGRVGQTLLLSRTQLNVVAAPGTWTSWPVTVTNTGTAVQQVALTGRTFGKRQNIQTGSVTLNDSTSPQFVNYGGLPNNYGVFHFKVPAGTDRLSGSIAYPAASGSTLNARVRLIFIDPLGRFAAHSIPQGVGNFGNVDVRAPVTGTWTGVIFGDMAADGGTNGVIPWQVATQKFVPFGFVSPSNLTLGPGQSKTVTVSAETPEVAGDSAGSIVLTSRDGGVDPFIGAQSNSIPVTLRSLVDVAHGGHFAGTLTGGNGRDPGEGQVQYYQFNVGPGHTSLTANLSLANDPQNWVGAYLVGPDGAAVGFGENTLNGTGTQSLSADTLHPKAGLWTLIVDFAEPIVGNEISERFSGVVKLDNTGVVISSFPAHRTLPAGAPYTFNANVTNNSPATQAFFIDARLSTTTSLTLANLNPPTSSSGYVLPLTSGGPEWLIPSHTSSIQTSAVATLGVIYDFGADQGDPDLVGYPTGTNTAAGTYTPSGGTVQPGLWYANPAEVGPYAGPAPAGLVNMAATVTTQAFDTSVTTTGGDLWQASLDPNALASFQAFIVNPGETISIPITVTPSGPSGTVVSGVLYVDSLMQGVAPYGELTGSEVAAVPYSYSIQ